MRWLFLALLWMACDPSGAARERKVAVVERAPPQTTLCEPLARVVLIPSLEGMLEPCGCTARSQGGVDRLAAAIAPLTRAPRRTFVVTVGDVFAHGKLHDPSDSELRWREDALIASLAEIDLDAIPIGARDQELHRAALQRLAKSTAAPLVAVARDRHDDGFQVRAHVVKGAVSLQVVARPIVQASSGETYTRFELSSTYPGAVSSHAHFGHLVTRDQADPELTYKEGELTLRGGREGEGFWLIELWGIEGTACLPGVGEHVASQRSADAVTAARFIRLDAQSPSHPKLRVLLDQLFARIGAEHTQRPARPRASESGAPSYVGSRTCAACHTRAYVWWTQTPHGKAYATLRRRGRELDLTCIGCHVTAFDVPGGAALGALGELENVGCESCHGPGSAHVDNPRPPLGALHRQVADRICLHCHDPEHSDGFEVASARARLLSAEHGLTTRN